MDRAVFGANRELCDASQDRELCDASQDRELCDAVQNVTTLAALGILGTLMPLYLDAQLHQAVQNALRRRYCDLTQLGTLDGAQ